jgi:hypothetical protein
MKLTGPLRRLRNAVAKLKPPANLDNRVGHIVGDWVAREQPASDAAAPVAERYVHERLEDAWRLGRSHGIRRCWTVWWPLLALCVLAFAFVVTKVIG